MDLLKFLGEHKSSEARLRREFPVVIERQTSTSKMHFDARVTGYFVGRSGKADFVTEKVIVQGIPEMNIKSFLPDEIREVKRYALSVEYPRMLSSKL
jgi:hypothetical protein